MSTMLSFCVAVSLLGYQVIIPARLKPWYEPQTAVAELKEQPFLGWRYDINHDQVKSNNRLQYYVEHCTGCRKGN